MKTMDELTNAVRKSLAGMHDGIKAEREQEIVEQLAANFYRRNSPYLKQNELEYQIAIYETSMRQADDSAKKARAIIAGGLCDPNNEIFCPAAEKLQGEWQEAISETLAKQMEETGLGLEADPDWWGGESGDPLDYTLNEVRWPLNALEDYYYDIMEKHDLIKFVKDDESETIWQAIARLLESYQEKGLDGSKL